MKPRIYIDTSVIGGCEDEEFAEWSRRLMEEFAQGSKIALISDLTRKELEEAPNEVQAILSELEGAAVEQVVLSQEAEDLANAYVASGAVTLKNVIDAQHIAIASVERADVLVSWNFRHVVNIERIRQYHAVNVRLGYPLLEIRSPREVLHEEDL